MKNLFKYILFVGLLVCVSCSQTPKVPDSYVPVEATPTIYPDYVNVTVPCNIAPLTFRIGEQCSDAVIRLTAGDKVVVYGGTEVAPSMDDWGALLSRAVGSYINVEVFTESGDRWYGYKPFSIFVSGDLIDPYISYRLIPPSYVAYEKLSISQRNLSNYDESVIYSNKLVSSEPDGQCINCHAYKNYRTDNMQFHVRQYKGGTVFVHDGEVKKINLKTDSTISAGVYPSFNPVYDIVAYSVNSTGQVFHTKDANKVEVQDKESDIIVYNPVKGTVTHVADSKSELEVFPCWSPDGKKLYYCSSAIVRDTALTRDAEMVKFYREVKYDVLCRDWNPETGEFGRADTVFVASAIGKSATFPRISPCGRYMLFALAEYGCFHIWHKDADLYILDLSTGDYWSLDNANSLSPESYHAWSSNGKWILFASRRDDTNYSRLYIAHMNADGTSDKAFLLPQESAEFYDFFDRSYNVPEFMVEPVAITPQEFAEVIRIEPLGVAYSSEVK